VVFTGFGLLLLGLLVTYFWVPEVIWCAVTPDGERDRVVVGGMTEKYHESFGERFADLCESLRREGKTE